MHDEVSHSIEGNFNDNRVPVEIMNCEQNKAHKVLTKSHER